MVQLFNTHELAGYLRIKQRKVYDLVQNNEVPFTRVGGKLLFPKIQVDQWLADRGAIEPAAEASQAPLVIAGSHDPFLEWCVAESGCGLALLGGGVLIGLDRFSDGEALACSVHGLDTLSDDHDDIGELRRRLGERKFIVVEWARRDQGIVVAAGNPLGIGGIADLAARKARVVVRQAEAGTQIRFERLMAEAGLSLGDLDIVANPIRTETEVGLAVLGGHADAGPAIRAVASLLRLDFVPLHTERYDLVMMRRDYFEPPLQKLIRFARSAAAQAKAAELTGYDLSGHGSFHYNPS